MHLVCKRILFCIIFLFVFFIIFSFLLYPVFTANSIIFPYSFTPFDLAKEYPDIWITIKKIYLISFIFSNLIITNLIYNYFIKDIILKKQKTIKRDSISNEFYLTIGYDPNNNLIQLPFKSLYQNILITGTIGTGKTSSAMYPFTKQLIQYKNYSANDKIGLLILDVKGNYHKEVLKFAADANRLDDIIEISLTSGIYYNPLDKPHLKPSILANRLKTILTLFSKNSSESYWLDKSDRR